MYIILPKGKRRTLAIWLIGSAIYRTQFLVLFCLLFPQRMLYPQSFFQKDGNLCGWKLVVLISAMKVARKNLLKVKIPNSSVRAFECAKVLTLSDDVLRALCCGTISLSSEFKRLVNLEASIECCHWSSLQDLIQSSHSLEVFTIHQIPNHFCGEGDSNWIDPIEVPRCLSNSLKKVVIDGYLYEREMIHYLLKHGSVLEAMKITCDRFWFDEEFQLLQEICKFLRKSPACEIEILRVE